MSDLIERQAAIDALDTAAEHWNIAEPYHEGMRAGSRNAARIVLSLPSVQQWIPCSERLPEEDIKVLVTDEDGDIYIAYYDYNEWSEDPKIEWWTGEFRIYPIAWMPLPEPWKGEQP